MDNLLDRALWLVFLRVSPSAFPSCAYLLRYLPGEVRDRACSAVISHYNAADFIPISKDNIPMVGNDEQDAILAALLVHCDEAVAKYGGKGYYRQFLSEADALPAPARRCIQDLLYHLFSLAIEEAFAHDGSKLVEIIKEDNGTRTC